MMNQQPQSRHGAGVAGTLLLSLLFLLSLLLLMPAGCCCALAPEQWSQERIYAAEVHTVNPELEGKLVKLKIAEIHSDAEVEDALFGIRGQFLTLSRDVFDFGREAEGTEFICGKEVDVLLSEGMMDGIRTSSFSPPSMRSGAFTLLHAGRLLSQDRDAPLLPLPPREQWPEVLRQKGEVPEPGVIFWRKSERPGDLFAHVRFRALRPGVLPCPLYVVARQRGNTLDLNDAHAGWLLQEDFDDTRDIGDMDGYDGLGLSLAFLSALVCTPLGWALLTLYIRLHRELSARGGWTRTSLALAMSVLFLLIVYPAWRLMIMLPVSPMVLFLLLPPLHMMCLRRSLPRFSARSTALLYLPSIILSLGAVMPYAFRWELRLPLAVLSALSSLVVAYLTRRRTLNPDTEKTEHPIQNMREADEQ